ncbi:hypothetical protein GCQ56_02240 [Marinifilum sp. N1E240]|uniref:transglutaminase domain-containing protein n=1 Tax=Marinifilum sp. N1E240 TaxID=2608082 RepID=UPI00128D4551|nr:transglutaminase domain-containing protein [Marinifilum sp. N1E240]MPQ45816.1 hypothetical protein [Marinifilum sp. N1E240]
MTKRFILISILYLVAITFIQAQDPDFGKYRLIDRHVRKTPDKVSDNLIDLHQYLISGANSKEEQLRAFYMWIITNVHYKDEVELLYDPNVLFYIGSNNCVSPVCVLKKRKAVCEGFSKLFQFFCIQSGFECYSIGGYISKTGNFQDRATHSWNVVKINNEWRFFDLSWSNAVLHHSGIKSRTNKFYMVHPEKFILTHLPLTQMWQFLKTPITINHFNRGEETIQKYINESSINYNYSDTLSFFNSLPYKKRRLKTAKDIVITNPGNTFNQAIEYYRYSRIAINYDGEITSLHYYDLLEAKEIIKKAINLFKQSTGISSEIMMLNSMDSFDAIQRRIESAGDDIIHLE